MADNKGSKDGRARAWCAIVYPDSAPDNWRDLLEAKCIPWVESPLHNPDPDGPPEERRKPHYHIVLSFEGMKSKDQIKEILKELNCSLPQVVHNLRSYVRYCLHLDQPIKQQFALNEIIPHCGMDIKDYLINQADRYFYISEMEQYIVDNNITEFWVMMDLCRQFHRDTWFPLLCDNSAFVINLFIKSFRHDPDNVTKLLQDKTPFIDSPAESTN